MVKTIYAIFADLSLALAAGSAPAQTRYPSQAICILVDFTPGVA